MAIGDNLISFWELESDGIDSKGTDTLTVVGSPTFPAGAVGNGVSLNGSSQYLHHASDSSLQLGGTACSIAFWLKAGATGAYQYMVGKWDEGGSTLEYLVYIGIDNFIKFLVSPDGSATGLGNVTGADATITSGFWYFIAATYDLSTLKISVNDGTVYSTSYAGGIFNGSVDFALGAGYVSGVPTFYTTGILDQVGLWKRVLSAGDITWLYNAGAGRSYADLGISASGTTIEVQTAVTNVP